MADTQFKYGYNWDYDNNMELISNSINHCATTETLLDVSGYKGISVDFTKIKDANDTGFFFHVFAFNELPTNDTTVTLKDSITTSTEFTKGTKYILISVYCNQDTASSAWASSYPSCFTLTK